MTTHLKYGNAPYSCCHQMNSHKVWGMHIVNHEAFAKVPENNRCKKCHKTYVKEMKRVAGTGEQPYFRERSKEEVDAYNAELERKRAALGPGPGDGHPERRLRDIVDKK